jgi:hypothetical protein
MKVAGYIRFALKQRIARARATIAKKQKLVAVLEKELAKVNKKTKK